MQPVMFSVKEAMAGRPYWKRIGRDVCYYKNNYSKSVHCDDEPNFMTASFTVTFPHEGDICYFAYHYPYSYSKLLVSEKKSYSLFNLEIPFICNMHVNVW